MNKNIPQNILDELPEFDLDKYEYEWGPCQFKPGIQHYCNGVWENGNGGFIKFIHRWPKPEPRYELIPRKDMRISDEFCRISSYGTDREKWRKCSDFDDLSQFIVIRRRIEE